MKNPLRKLVPALILLTASVGLGQDAATAAKTGGVKPVPVIKKYETSTAKPQVIAWEPMKVPNAYTIVAPHILPGDGWYANAGNWAADDIKARLGGYGPVILQSQDNHLLNNLKDLVDGFGSDGKPQKFWAMQFENGIADTVAGIRQFCGELKAKGVTPTYWVADGEAGRCNWNLTPENMAYLRDLPRYQAYARAFGMPADPTRLDGDGIVKFNAELGRIQENVRKLAIYDIFEEEFPGVPYSDFGSGGLTPADARIVPDSNNWPQWSYRPLTSASSPVAYGYIGNLRSSQPQLLRPAPCLAYQINIMLSAWRVDSSKPVWPWLSGRNLSNALDETYFRELWIHALVINGGHALYFNSGASAEDDQAVLWACQAYEKNAASRSGGKPWSSKFITVTNTAFASAWVYPDGSMLIRATLAPGAKPTTLDVNGQRVMVAIEDNAGCWRTTPPLKK